MTDNPRLLIISPVRDEATYLQKTIDSVTAQTVHPTTWLIVDDGSKDEALTHMARFVAWTLGHNKSGGTAADAPIFYVDTL